MQITESIRQELQRFALLQGFSERELRSIAETLTERTLTVGEFLFNEGDTSKEIYFIRSGKAEVYRSLHGNKTGQLLTGLEAGDEVGELALIDGAPRSASVRAVEEMRVFELNPERLPMTLMLLSRLISNVALASTKKLRRQRAEPNPKISTAQAPLIDELQRFPLLKGISDTELNTLAETLEARTLPAGEYLFDENENSNELYFIRSGKIEICKQDSSGTAHAIAELNAGQEIGELALVDGEPRSASARATEDSNLFVLNTGRLPTNLMLLSRLISNIALTSPTKLRQSNIEHVQSLKRELAMARTQNEFGQFFIYVIGIFTIAIFANHILYTYIQSAEFVYTHVYGWSYLLIFLLPTFITVWVMKLPLSELGMTLKNWQKSLREGITVSIVMTIVAVLLITILRYIELIPNNPIKTEFLIDWELPNYFLHSFLQELFARGIFQSTLQRIFNDQRGVKSVFLTSVFFGLAHIQFGLFAVFIIFVSSLLFGAFYLRHHNLIGVTILHGSLGTIAFSMGLL